MLLSSQPNSAATTFPSMPPSLKPTPMPSFEPTAVQVPSVAPSSETAVPSVESSNPPLMHPTTIPTESLQSLANLTSSTPTRHPTLKGSTVVSPISSSVSPTVTPSSLTITSAPSCAPALVSSSAVPTTRRSQVLTFLSYILLQSPGTLTLDAESEIAIAYLVSIIMEIDPCHTWFRGIVYSIPQNARSTLRMLRSSHRTAPFAASSNDTIIVALETTLDLVDFPAVESAEELYLSRTALLVESMDVSGGITAQLQSVAVQFNASSLYGAEVVEIVLGTVQIEEPPSVAPSTRSPTKKEDKSIITSSGLTVEYIVLLGFGVMLLLLTVVLIVWWVRCRKHTVQDG